MGGTFGFQKGLKVLLNNVFRFIQQTLNSSRFSYNEDPLCYFKPKLWLDS